MKHEVTFKLKNTKTKETVPVVAMVTIEKSNLFPYGNEMGMTFEYQTGDPMLHDQFYDIRYDHRWSPDREREYIKQVIKDQYPWIWKPIYIKVH